MKYHPPKLYQEAQATKAICYSNGSSAIGIPFDSYCSNGPSKLVCVSGLSADPSYQTIDCQYGVAPSRNQLACSNGPANLHNWGTGECSTGTCQAYASSCQAGGSQ